jgi:hypothetical protein
VSPKRGDSVFDEPHMRRRGSCWKCGYDRAGLNTGENCPECGAGPFKTDRDEASRVDHSVWDEAGLAPEGARRRDAARASGETYAEWVRARKAGTAYRLSWAVVWGVAVLAGPWGVLGALADGLGSAQAGWSGMLALVLVGPAVEEVMKVALLAYIVERRPYLLKSGVQVLLCALAGGAAFAAIENLLYLHVYIDRPSPAIVLWRWTACVALHAGCSVIAGMGLLRVWHRIWAQGERPDLLGAYPFTVAAIAVHGAYNGVMLLLEARGHTF